MRTEAKITIAGGLAILLGGSSLAAGFADNSTIDQIVNPQVDLAKGSLATEQLNAAHAQIRDSRGEIARLVESTSWSTLQNRLNTADMREKISQIKQKTAELDKLDDPLATLDLQADRESYARVLRRPYAERDSTNTFLMITGAVVSVAGMISELMFGLPLLTRRFRPTI